MDRYFQFYDSFKASGQIGFYDMGGDFSEGYPHTLPPIVNHVLYNSSVKPISYSNFPYLYSFPQSYTPSCLYSTHRENSRDVQLEFIVSQRIGENGLFVYIFSMWKNKVTQPLCQEVWWALSKF